MIRIQTEEDDDGGTEGGSSGTSLEQHGGVSADQVSILSIQLRTGVCRCCKLPSA